MEDEEIPRHVLEERLSYYQNRALEAEAERDRYRATAERRWAMRDELERALGVGDTYGEEQFERGMVRIRALLAAEADLRDALAAASIHAAEHRRERDRAARYEEETEQLRIQLAACGVAAMGGTSDPVVARRGDYGWSPAYEDTLRIRRERDRYEEALREIAERAPEPERRLARAALAGGSDV